MRPPGMNTVQIRWHWNVASTCSEVKLAAGFIVNGVRRRIHSALKVGVPRHSINQTGFGANIGKVTVQKGTAEDAYAIGNYTELFWIFVCMKSYYLRQLWRYSDCLPVIQQLFAACPFQLRVSYESTM
jgi:hypothetical protein